MQCQGVDLLAVAQKTTEGLHLVRRRLSSMDWALVIIVLIIGFCAGWLTGRRVVKGLTSLGKPQDAQPEVVKENICPDGEDNGVVVQSQCHQDICISRYFPHDLDASLKNRSVHAKLSWLTKVTVFASPGGERFHLSKECRGLRNRSGPLKEFTACKLCTSENVAC